MPVVNQAIEQAIQELRERGLGVSCTNGGDQAILIIEPYPLPVGWSKLETALLLKLPQSFPNGKPDMFWTDHDLTLPGGQDPKQATVFEELCDRRWRRFSWHPLTWDPGRDSIHTFIAFVDQRLAQRR